MSDHSSHRLQGWELLGARLVKSRNWVVFVIAVPWLGAQMYYARPFAQVVSGWVSRHQFLERYVALTGDFAVLDRILPKDAVLYVGNTRVPNFYAPRPVVLSLLDIRGRPPIYRLMLQWNGGDQGIGEEADLSCGATVYANNAAIIETYRTPGMAPLLGAVKVQECRTGAAESNVLHQGMDSDP